MKLPPIIQAPTIAGDSAVKAGTTIYECPK